MNNRGYIVTVFAVILLIWGPIDHSWPFWLAIRTGYLIILPIVTWFLLGWIWRIWKPDNKSEDRLSRTLASVTAGVLLVLAVLEAMSDSHIGNTEVVRTRDGLEGVGDLCLYL